MCSLHCEYCNQKMKDFQAKLQDGGTVYLTSEAEIIQNLLEVTSKLTGKNESNTQRSGRRNPFCSEIDQNRLVQNSMRNNSFHFLNLIFENFKFYDELLFQRARASDGRGPKST